MLRAVTVVLTVIVGTVFGVAAQSKWETVLRFTHQQAFGVTDPVFHKEVSFYVFSLPFLRSLQGWLLWLSVVTLLGTVGVYLLSYGLQWRQFRFPRRVTAHLGVRVVAILPLLDGGYWLGIWQLVFSSRGVVFGAGYADIHAKLPAFWILIAAVVVTIGIFVASVWGGQVSLVPLCPGRMDAGRGSYWRCVPRGDPAFSGGA